MVERAIIVIASGLFIGILGALIRYAGMMHLIAGYDPDNIADDEGLANFIGTQTLIVALLTVTVGGLELWEPITDSAWYWVVFGIAIVTMAVRMVRGARHYQSSSEHNQRG